MKVFALVGARPNFIKIAALERAFRSKSAVDFKIVHTGQHSAPEMYDRFFEQLSIPRPHHEITLHSKIPHRMLAQITHEFGDLLFSEKPDALILVGDVNSTLGGAMAALKTGVPVAHVEAGLRCADPNLPEEANRVLTDRVSRWLFTTETSANAHLLAEGIDPNRIHFVGNVMIDALLHYLPLSRSLDVPKQLGLSGRRYILCTIHRNFNITREAALRKIVAVLKAVSAYTTVVFPVHPNTAFWLQKFDLLRDLEQIDTCILLPPQGYLEFVNLLENAALVVTDSGGVQEESAFLNIPCITFRPSTERPVTLTNGRNRLVYHETVEEMIEIVGSHLKTTSNAARTAGAPELWDGKAAERVVEILTQEL